MAGLGALLLQSVLLLPCLILGHLTVWALPPRDQIAALLGVYGSVFLWLWILVGYGFLGLRVLPADRAPGDWPIRSPAAHAPIAVGLVFGLLMYRFELGWREARTLSVPLLVQLGVASTSWMTLELVREKAARERS